MTTPTHIDFQGHHGFALNTLLDLNGAPDPDDWTLGYWRDKADDWIRRIALLADLEEMATRREDASAILGRSRLAFTAHTTCGECGETVHFHQEAGRFMAQSACAAPGGLKPYTIDIAVASGRLVFGNDLRALTLVDDAHNVNTAIGRKRVTEAFAAQGMLSVAVGNSCPDVVTHGNTLLVANIDRNTDKDDLVVHGRVTTDFWRVSAMDADLFAERCQVLGCDTKSFDTFTVAVEPGTYEVRVLLPDTEAPGTHRHASIHRVDRPAPVLTFPLYGEAARVEDSGMAHEIASIQKRAYLAAPTRSKALHMALFMGGMGYRWHQGQLRDLNGHPKDQATRGDTAQGAALRAATTIPTMASAHLFPTMMEDLQSLPIGRASTKIDPWWLAAGILTVAATIATHQEWAGLPPAKVPADQRPWWTPERMAEAQVRLDTLLTDLFALAAAQGLGRDGRLDALLAETHTFLTTA